MTLTRRDLRPGDRITITADHSHVVANYELLIPAGSTGTVTPFSGDDYTWIKLDTHHDDLNDWNNELGFGSEDDNTDYFPPMERRA